MLTNEQLDVIENTTKVLLDREKPYCQIPTEQVAEIIAELKKLREIVHDIRSLPCQTCGQPYSTEPLAGCVSDHLWVYRDTAKY